MLTRAQVARRLGKSIATVRRLEGVHLFPSVGRDGVHRFEVTEVDTLLRDIRRGLRLPAGMLCTLGNQEELQNRLAEIEERVGVLEGLVEVLCELEA